MLFIVNNPKPLFLASGLLFMLGSVGMGVGMGMQQRATARRRTRGGRARYLDYLHGVRVQLQAAGAAQRAASAWRHPPPDALLAITGSSARLWERRPEDADFLVLRVGEGRLPLATPFHLPSEDGLAAQSDPVCAEAIAQLAKAQSTVPNQAVAVDLKASPVVTMFGQRDAVEDAARALLSQLAVLHAPDDVRLLLCTRQASAPAWEWMKWLPHLRGASDGETGPTVCDAEGLDAAITTRAATRPAYLARRAGGSRPVAGCARRRPGSGSGGDRIAAPDAIADHADRYRGQSRGGAGRGRSAIARRRRPARSRTRRSRGGRRPA
jgi:DNA segregation ATPase FtsK/SpoIIIE-like protein